MFLHRCSCYVKAYSVTQAFHVCQDRENVRVLSVNIPSFEAVKSNFYSTFCDAHTGYG